MVACKSGGNIRFERNGIEYLLINQSNKEEHTFYIIFYGFTSWKRGTRWCRGNCEIETKIGTERDGRSEGVGRVMTVTVTVSGMEGGSATVDSDLRHLVLVWK